MTLKTRYRIMLYGTRANMVLSIWNAFLAVSLVMVGHPLAQEMLGYTALHAICWYMCAGACETMQTVYQLDKNGDPIKKEEHGEPN